eukprot:SAG11_NODE_2247_length_3636_cov_3.037037_5_plen_115_part_00
MFACGRDLEANLINTIGGIQEALVEYGILGEDSHGLDDLIDYPPEEWDRLDALINLGSEHTPERARACFACEGSVAGCVAGVRGRVCVCQYVSVCVCVCGGGGGKGGTSACLCA